MVSHRLAAIAVAVGTFATEFSQVAFAQGMGLPPVSGNWMVRLCAVNPTAINKPDPVPALATSADAIQINNKVLPELGISYFLTPYLAAELTLIYPQ